MDIRMAQFLAALCSCLLTGGCTSSTCVCGYVVEGITATAATSRQHQSKLQIGRNLYCHLPTNESVACLSTLLPYFTLSSVITVWIFSWNCLHAFEVRSPVYNVLSRNHYCYSYLFKVCIKQKIIYIFMVKLLSHQIFGFDCPFHQPDQCSYRARLYVQVDEPLQPIGLSIICHQSDNSASTNQKLLLLFLCLQTQ